MKALILSLILGFSSVSVFITSAEAAKKPDFNPPGGGAPTGRGCGR
jgi:hypothetical protein